MDETGKLKIKHLIYSISFLMLLSSGGLSHSEVVVIIHPDNHHIISCKAAFHPSSTSDAL